MPHEKFSLQNAKEFAHDNTFEIKGDKTRCFDGRYSSSESHGSPFARAGADAGLITVIASAVEKLEVSFPRELIIDALIDSAQGIENICLHARDACEHDAILELFVSQHTLSNETVDFIKKSCHRLEAEGARIIEPSGEHNEKAIFIVSSSSRSLSSQNDAKDQVFVYHKTLDEERIEKISSYIAERGHADQKDLAQAIHRENAHYLTLAMSVCANDLPIYDISVEKNGRVFFENDTHVDVSS